MPYRLRTALKRSLAPHLRLSQSRVETVCLFLIALIQGRTVNLTHVASQFPGPASPLCLALPAPATLLPGRSLQSGGGGHPGLVRLLNLSRPERVALDRAQSPWPA